MAVEFPFRSKLFAEFLGTFFLVLTVTCNVLAGTSGAFVALSIAASLMTSVYALGAVSGAHLNPAVSVACCLANQMKWDTAIYYIIVQVLGGMGGSLVGSLMFGRSFALEPGMGYSWTEAAGAEILYTFMLCFVVLNTACCMKTVGNQYFGLSIGFVIVAAGYAVGSISGANLNPAVSIGIDTVDFVEAGKTAARGWSLAYTGWQLVGAALAALVYRVVRPTEFDRPEPTGIMEKLISEFLGTFVLVVTVGLNVITGSLAAALSIAASLMCMIYALATVSGAHFNPAVTFALWMSGRGTISTEHALKYVCAQLFGGLCGALAYAGLTKGKTFPLAPVGTHSWIDALLAEVLFTFVLSYVVLTVASVKEASKDMFGLAIGFCVVVGGFAAGSVSGGSLNPAVSFGIDTVASLFTTQKWMNCLPYAAAELGGAALAATVFSATHPGEWDLPQAVKAKAAN